jgi:hypothetical protein
VAAVNLVSSASIAQLRSLVADAGVKCCIDFLGRSYVVIGDTGESIYISDIINRLASDNSIGVFLISDSMLNDAQVILRNLRGLELSAVDELSKQSLGRYLISPFNSRLSKLFLNTKKIDSILHDIISKKEEELSRLSLDTAARSRHSDPLTRCLQKLDNLTMVNDCGGGVYLGTNEVNLNVARELIQSRPKSENSVHIGFSSWHNFDLIVEGQCSRAVLCDFNPNTKTFLKTTLDLIKKSSDREEFVKKMDIYFKRLRYDVFRGEGYYILDNIKYRVFLSEEAEVRFELTREGSWLSTDRGFDYIKMLASNDKIAIITEDILNTNVFVKIKKILAGSGCDIFSFYVSNIGEYCKKNAAAFISTVRSLISDETVVIAAPNRSTANMMDGFSGDMVQTACLGRDCVGSLRKFFKF